MTIPSNGGPISMLATITAYCACTLCCGPNATGLTASGTRPIQGITVAAPRSIPFGTRVYISGVGWRVVQDRTARRYDGRYDVYHNSHRAAINYGKQKRTITIKQKHTQ